MVNPKFFIVLFILENVENKYIKFIIFHLYFN